MNQEELKNLLSYDPDTGLFKWRKGGKGRRKDLRAGSIMSHGYVAIGHAGKDYTAHRLAWLYVYGKLPDGVIDHINGDRADNRICNLRDVSQVENMQNVYTPKSDNKSGYRGVSWHAQRQKFTARIMVGKRYLSLGLHDTAQEAAQAYEAAKAKHHVVRA